MVVEGFSQFFGAGRLWNARESVLVPRRTATPAPVAHRNGSLMESAKLSYFTPPEPTKALNSEGLLSLARAFRSTIAQWVLDA